MPAFVARGAPRRAGRYSEDVGSLLVAVLVAQADGGSDFASAMRDEARRNEAACAARERARTDHCVGWDVACAVKRVMEFQDEHGRPGFLVIFRDELDDEPSNELFGRVELFTENGRPIPLFLGADVLDESGKLTQLAGGPLFLALQASLEIPCHDDGGTPLLQRVLVVHALPRAPLVLALGPPAREANFTGDGGVECPGGVCTKQGLRLTEPAPDWSWALECGRTCTVRIGPRSALERGRPSAVFTWNKSAKRFDGPKDGAGFSRLEDSLGPRLERVSREYCRPAASRRDTQDVRTR